MSHIFYDHLIVLEELEHHIRQTTSSNEEKEELWNLIDEIVHHRIIGCILDNLPSDYHEDFLDKFHKFPHDEELINYLNDKSGKKIEELIINEVESLNKELLEEIVR